MERPIGGRPRPLLVTATLLGGPVVLYLASLLALRGASLRPGFVAAYACATLWMLLYPFLLWRFGARLLPGFFVQARDLVQDPAPLEDLARRHRRAFDLLGWSLAVPFALLGGAIYWRGLDVVAQGGGLHGASDPLFLAGAAIVAWGGVLVGFGMGLTLVTLSAIAGVARLPLALHPHHPDTRSGLKPFGDLALHATVMVAGGALVLPLVFLYAPSLDDPYLLLGVLCHTLAILATFVVPLVLVRRGAEAARGGILARLQEEYESLRARLHAPDGDKLQLRAQLETVRREQEETRAMRLAPFQSQGLVELTSSVLLPVLILLVTVGLRRLGIAG